MSIGQELLDFIQKSPSTYHAIETAAGMLEEKGFTELLEGQCRNLKVHGKYYVKRNASSLIAFILPEEEITGFQIGACHSDSPTFRIKPQAEIVVQDKYVQLNTEPYGGSIYSTWMDRPLSVAGKIVVQTEDRLESRLVSIDRDLLVIPNVAIHMNRKINAGHDWNPQVDLIPLFGGAKAKGTFLSSIAEAAEVSEDAILGTDLFLYNRTPGALWGAEEEYVSAPRLDDLQCAFSLLKAFMEVENPSAVPVLAFFDNEEVGSLTKQGADSTFLTDVLRRLAGEHYDRLAANSFLVSADNAHAVHPNHPEFTDPTNKAYLNDGVVIKYNGNQKYVTDAVSEAVFRLLCKRTGISCQTYTNRSNMPGGTTLGNISNRHLSVNAVDIGLPQLAMHSAYETAGVRDMADLMVVMKEFFTSKTEEIASGIYQVQKM